MSEPRLIEAVVTIGADMGLTVNDVHNIAVSGSRVFASEDALERVRRSSAVVERALIRGRKVYGLNTYVGHLRDREIAPDDIIDYQHQLVAMHARGIGDPMAEHDVRALMLARIVGMSRGGSGAHPDIFATLIQMLNAGVHPIVPQGGSVGASDLTQMAAVGMVLIGRGDAI